MVGVVYKNHTMMEQHEILSSLILSSLDDVQHGRYPTKGTDLLAQPRLLLAEEETALALAFS